MTGRFAVLFLAASVLPAAAQDAASLDALVDAEKLMLKNDCKSLELGRDFVRRVDIDGNRAEDVLLDFEEIDCDGSNRKFCGDKGCLKAIFLQKADGSFTGIGRMGAFDITFDRPNGMWPSFFAVLPGSECGKPAADPCAVRYELRNGQLRMLRE